MDPTSLKIIDFDQTLFRSPAPNPFLWDSYAYGMLKGDFVSWFQNPNTLPVDVLKNQEDLFIPFTLESFYKAQTAEGCLTVVLTGRNKDPFEPIVKALLSLRNLKPDMVVLKEPIFGKKYSTLEFKHIFLKELLNFFPSITDIEIFEDREKHVSKFEEFISGIGSENPLFKGQVHHIVARHLYFPVEYELDLVSEILHKINQSPINLKKKKGKFPRSISQYPSSRSRVILLESSFQKLFDLFQNPLEISDEWNRCRTPIIHSISGKDTVSDLLDKEVLFKTVGYYLNDAIFAIRASASVANCSEELECYFVLAFNPSDKYPSAILQSSDWTTCPENLIISFSGKIGIHEKFNFALKY